MFRYKVRISYHNATNHFEKYSAYAFITAWSKKGARAKARRSVLNAPNSKYFCVVRKAVRI
jgi:hypothetical protein